ncbi:SDR family NAD(P)-dependent oxidoreductase, partial [Brevibacterium aurantiacum]|uniref:SDR family NAD(P)-dependent oxidoreductase n=1 Tax=Brevibacterium aurantiacum TaxID=273384 RepID=UPI003F8DD999
MGQGTPAQAVYSASKAALFRIAYSIVRFGHDKGLRIFEVAPGVVETAMTKSMPVHVFRQGDDWTSPEPVTGLALSLGPARTLDNAPDGNEAIEQVWEQTPAVTCHNELDPGTFNATDASVCCASVWKCMAPSICRRCPAPIISRTSSATGLSTTVPKWLGEPIWTSTT